jgi:hypothetical protein
MTRRCGYATLLVLLAGCPAGQQSGQPADGRKEPSGGFDLLQSRASEQWTILCSEFSNQDHRSVCEAFAVTLRNTPGIRAADVSCAHDDIHGTSQLLYGSYTREVEARSKKLSTPPQLVSDMNLLQDLGDDQGRRAFPQVRMIHKGEAFEGPSEWALVNARSGQYTLQIAVFYPEQDFDEPQRAAVEFTRQLRSEGFEAYYHHGAGRKSIVTVGVFGPQATEGMRLDSSTGLTRYGPEVENLRKRDPRFQFNHENGRKRSKVVQGVKYPPYSFLVPIPRGAEGS